MSRYIFSLFFLNTVLFAAQITSSVDEEIAQLNKEDQLLDQQLSFYQAQNEKMKQIFSNPDTELAYLETVEHDMEKLKALFHPNSPHQNEQEAALDELEPELHRRAAALGYPLKGTSEITPLGSTFSGASLNQPHRDSSSGASLNQPHRDSSGGASLNQPHRATLQHAVQNNTPTNPYLSTPSIIPHNNMAQFMNSPYAEYPMNPGYINNQQMYNQDQMMYNQGGMYNQQQMMYDQPAMTNNHPQASFWSPLSDGDASPQLIEYPQEKSNAQKNDKTNQEIDANILRSISGRGNDNDNTIESMQSAQRQSRGTSSNFNANDINLLRRR